jgi:REP element-mobilizing transposase RayT
MSRLPRKFVFEPHEVGVYHCINRCVRRSMLCGWDPFTQRSYEHRKRWLQQRLMFLASVMAIDIEGFCTMDNHLHLIVRNRPDVVANWSAEENRPQVAAVVSAV